MYNACLLEGGGGGGGGGGRGEIPDSDIHSGIHVAQEVHTIKEK